MFDLVTAIVNSSEFESRSVIAFASDFGSESDSKIVSDSWIGSGTLSAPEISLPIGSLSGFASWSESGYPLTTG